MAALALPELTATARSADRSQRSRQTSTGARIVSLFRADGSVADVITQGDALAGLAGAAWLACAALLVVWTVVPVIPDQLLRVEVGYAGSTAALSGSGPPPS